MMSLGRVVLAEGLKLRRSPALRLVWLLPLLFLAAHFLVFERPVLDLKVMPDTFRPLYQTTPVKVAVALWGGFFHPLGLALLGGLLFRPEHRFRMWRHLQVQPLSRRSVFGAKVVLALTLSALMLLLIWTGLVMIRLWAGWHNPVLAVPLKAWDLARVLGWLWLAGLPVLAFYLWISDRISSLAVPVVFGLVALLLTAALGVQENSKPWRRDLIPFVTPYFAAQWVMLEVTGKQEAHLGAKVFQDEPDIIRLPSGRRVRTRQSVPDEVLFPPPMPTPKWILATFSLLGGAMMLGLGFLDAGRARS